MSTLNRVTLIGHLGDNPEIRVTKTGTKVCDLSIATNKKWKNDKDETVEETEWHTVTCWAKKAEIAEKYLLKGHLVGVEGELKTDSYEDRQHPEIKHYRTKIIARELILLEKKPK